MMRLRIYLLFLFLISLVLLFLYNTSSSSRLHRLQHPLATFFRFTSHHHSHTPTSSSSSSSSQSRVKWNTASPRYSRQSEWEHAIGRTCIEPPQVHLVVQELLLRCCQLMEARLLRTYNSSMTYQQLYHHMIHALLHTFGDQDRGISGGVGMDVRAIVQVLFTSQYLPLTSRVDGMEWKHDDPLPHHPRAREWRCNATSHKMTSSTPITIRDHIRAWLRDQYLYTSGSPSQPIQEHMEGSNLREKLSLIYIATMRYRHDGFIMSEMFEDEMKRWRDDPIAYQQWQYENNLQWLRLDLIEAQYQRETSIEKTRYLTELVIPSHTNDTPFHRRCFIPLFVPPEGPVRACRCIQDASHACRIRIPEEAHPPIISEIADVPPLSSLPLSLTSSMSDATRYHYFATQQRPVDVEHPKISVREYHAAFHAPSSLTPQEMVTRHEYNYHHLPWEPGARVWALPHSSSNIHMIQHIHLGMRGIAGPSSTTDVFLKLATYFNIISRSDLIYLRCGLLSWLILNHDHSYDEIMSAAATSPYSLPYQPQRQAHISHEIQPDIHTFTHIFDAIIPDTAAIEDSSSSIPPPRLSMTPHSINGRWCHLWCNHSHSRGLGSAFNQRLVEHIRLHFHVNQSELEAKCQRSSVMEDQDSSLVSSTDGSCQHHTWAETLIAQWTPQLYGAP